MKIAYALFAWMICLTFIADMIFGFVVFPYAPYRQQGGAFVDKLGHPVTAEDYRGCKLWEVSLFVTVTPFALLAIGGLVWRMWRGGSLRRPKDH
jgi:hypothetical protein